MRILYFCFLLCSSAFALPAPNLYLPNQVAEGVQVLELPDEIQGEVQSYFDELNRRLDFPEEAGRAPIQVYLFKEIVARNAGAFVTSAYSNTVFWNADTYTDIESQDIDLWFMAHERTHFEASNQEIKDRRTAEYDADLTAIFLRLFRPGQRDEKGNPAPALVNVETLVRYLQSHSRYLENYINRNTLASAVKVRFLKERTKRDFPLESQSRDQISHSVAFVKDLMHDHSSAPPLPRDDTSAQIQIKTIVDRINQDYVTALEHLDRRRKIELRGLNEDSLRNLMTEFEFTFEMLGKYYQSNDGQKKVGSAFDRFALFDSHFFGAWHDLAANLESSTSRFSRDFDLNLALNDSDPVSIEDDEGLVKQWLSRSVVSPFNSFLFLTPRLLNSILDHGPNIDFQNRPRLVFLLSYLLAEAKTELTAAKSKSELYVRFETQFATKLRIVRADPRVAEAIIRLLTPNADVFDRLMNANLNVILMRLNLDQEFPGLRGTLLSRLNPEDFGLTHLALNQEPSQASAYFRDLFSKGQFAQFLAIVKHFKYDQRSLVKKSKLASVFLDFLKSNSPPAYVKGLDGAVDMLSLTNVIDVTEKADVFTPFRVEPNFNRPGTSRARSIRNRLDGGNWSIGGRLSLANYQLGRGRKGFGTFATSRAGSTCAACKRR